MNKLESLAVKLLNNIEKHTSLCENDYERNIFLQGVSEGYNAALKEHAANKDGWVRVEDRLPEKYDVDRNGSVWAWNKKLGFGAKVNPCFISIGSDYSHWMIIPNKPTN